MRKPRQRRQSRAGGCIPGQHKPLRMGRPRVVEDCELYHIVSSFVDDGKDAEAAQALHGYVRSWCKPWADWQLAVIALRARLFLGAVRQEIGRRSKLDPNQLRLMKGL